MKRQTQESVAGVRELFRSASGVELAELASRYSKDPRPGVQQEVERARRHVDARLSEERRLDALYQMEADCRLRGCVAVAGVDEVGRGALAGPLYTGACILPPQPRIDGLNDSKALTPARRRSLSIQIKEIALYWSLGRAEPEEIDRLGMTQSLRLAMNRAVDELGVKPDRVLVDGSPVHAFDNEVSVVKGDAKVASIAAASILAKVARDELMVALACEYPAYGFHVNMGYGTAEHISAIKSIGPSPVHRMSFSPCCATDTLF